ncbi:MAG: hypothetical protein D6690_17700 [Nitrospirae bacterium]|nr:MAG: hypothetical protein D6690_17700 [Nitrospirota bacterium]
MLVCGSCTGQDRTLEITAQEFRFIPSFLEVTEGQRIRFVLRNQGHEPHTFHAPLLLTSAHRVQGLSEDLSVQDGEAIVIHPGETVRFILEPRAGVYAFRCWIKGHAGMEGVMIVKARES